MGTLTTYATKDATSFRLDSNLSHAGYWSSGTENHLTVGHSGGGTVLSRSFIYMPIDFSGMLGINSATLWIKSTTNNPHSSLSGTMGIKVSRMTQDWGEGGNRGENLYSANDPWNFQGSVKGRATSSSFTTSGQATRTGISKTSDFYDVDVTAIVTAWFNGAANYGFHIMATDESAANKAHDFFDRNSGTTNRPYLVIDFQSNVAPNAPTNLSPTGNATVNTLSPTYSGTRSDPDANDFITKFQIQVYKDDGTTLVWDSGQVNGSGSTFSRVHGNGGTTYHTVLGNQFYRWRARTWDKEGLVSPYSSLQRFKANSAPSSPTVSVVSQPQNDLTTLTPQFQITHQDADPADDKMHAYTVIIETSTGTAVWNSGDIDTSGAPVSSVTVTAPTLSWQTSYRVRARTKDANGAWSSYSPNVSFATHAAAVPTNLDPSDTTISGLVPTFQGAKGHSSDNITSYQIQLYESDDTTLIWNPGSLTSGITNGASFSVVYPGSPALIHNTEYKWRVRITSSIGGTSSYSAMQTFMTAADANVPTQTAPIGTGIASLTPTFTGTRTSSNFNRINIQLYPSTSTNSNLGTPLKNVEQAQTASTSYSYVYSGSPTLQWDTTYKWRVRVSSDGGSSWTSWTGLAQFTTDAAGVAILVSPIPTNNYWITTNTPSLSIQRSGTDTIDQMQVRVFNAAGTVQIWDSGMVDVTNATTASLTYSGPTLSGGTVYSWQARYQKTTGPIGPYSARQTFRINAAPAVPTLLEPTPGFTFPDTLLPTFAANFSDADVAAMGDYPTEWQIQVVLENDTVVATKSISSGLSIGRNEYTWSGGDPALSYDTVYKWRTRFKDSLNVWGEYSAYQAFKLGRSPNGTIIAPSEGSTVNTVRPEIGWTYSSPDSKPQLSFKIELFRADTNVRIYQTTVISSATTFRPPAGYLQSGRTYMVRLTVADADSLEDPTPSERTFDVNLDAPNPIEGLSPTNDEGSSRIILEWDEPASLKSGHTFVRYNIYRKRVTDVEYELIDSTAPKSNVRYSDWYAGNGVHYHYRVTIVTRTATSGIELESGDDPTNGNIVTAALESDIWMFVGRDRSSIMELPVIDEDHERVVQQEAFETLGADRKVIIRGFVLGNEGTITCMWSPKPVPSEDDYQVEVEETLLGRRLVEYLTNNKGPHILKSPFGDVWDVEFAGPKFKWLIGGNLQVVLSWIEIGQTSKGEI